MKDSIDYAIANAKDYNEFIQILQDLDYVVTDRNDILSIRRDSYKRNTRIERQFGQNYTKENIFRRILETQPEYPYSPEPYLLINRTYQNYNTLKEKHFYKKGSLAYLLYQYEKLLGVNTERVLKLKIERITPELIQAIKKMDEFSNQIRFLAKNNINTDLELLEFEKRAYAKINPLKNEREKLWRKHKRAKTEEEKENIENKIIEISKQITPLAEEIKLCNSILLHQKKIKKYQLHQKIEDEKKKTERKISTTKVKVR